MKKLLVLALMAVLALASTASASKVLTNVPGTGMAVDGTVGTLTLGSTSFAVSTNVTLVATGNAGGYNVADKHVAGDLIFLSSSVASGIQEVAGEKGTPLASDSQMVSTIEGQFYTGI